MLKALVLVATLMVAALAGDTDLAGSMTSMTSKTVQDQAARVPPPPPTAPGPTDIHELRFDGGLAGLKTARLTAVATERGYDNQPSFTPDGGAILFTSTRGGLPTDIYEHDRKTRRTRQLTSTSEAEYSATITPDGKGFSVVRVEADATQRLWRFDRNGLNPQLVLTDIKPVGYHVWVDDDQLVLFVLGQPSTLQHARVSTGKAVVIAENIGRSLHRIPDTESVSFVHRESAEPVWLKRFDPETGTTTPLVQMRPGSNDGDVAWTPDGTVLMSAATKIYAWRGGDEDWREVYDAAAHKLGAVTRMAVAPDGRALAIVVNEAAR